MNGGWNVSWLSLGLMDDIVFSAVFVAKLLIGTKYRGNGAMRRLCIVVKSQNIIIKTAVLTGVDVIESVF